MMMMMLCQGWVLDLFKKHLLKTKSNPPKCNSWNYVYTNMRAKQNMLKLENTPHTITTHTSILDLSFYKAWTRPIYWGKIIKDKYTRLYVSQLYFILLFLIIGHIFCVVISQWINSFLPITVLIPGICCHLCSYWHFQKINQRE